MTVNDELGRKEMDSVTAYFKILSQHLPGRTDEDLWTSDLWLRNESKTSQI